MKAGDLVGHRDRAWTAASRAFPGLARYQRAQPPGVVLKTYASRAGETLVDVYWTATRRTICAYTPNELRAFDESR